MRKLMALVFTLVLLLTTVTPSFALGTKERLKDETIYFYLNSSGHITQASVVNALIPQDGLIEDFGDYATVKNLSNTLPIEREGNRIYAHIPEENSDPFYYEGQLKSAISPWNITINYQLDGEEIQADASAGASGHLTIKVAVTPNPAHPYAKAYTDRMTLSIAASLKSSLATNISAPDTTVVTSGGTKQINMTILPKQSKTFVISADVKNFEMDSLTISAVDAAISLDMDPKVASDGFDALEEGSMQMVSATKSLKTATQKLATGSDQINIGQKTMVAKWKQLTSSVKEFGTSLIKASLEGNQLSGAANDLVNQVATGQAKVASPELKQLASQLSTSADPTVQQLALATLGQITLIEETHKGIQQLNTGLAAYTQGVHALAEGFKGLESGLLAMDSGLADLSKAAGDLDKGLKQLNGQMNRLQAGQEDLHKGITSANDALSAALQEMPDLSKRDQHPLPSFVSSNNTPSTVQFIMRTSPIELPDPQDVAVEAEVETTLWQRFLNLFGL